MKTRIVILSALFVTQFGLTGCGDLALIALNPGSMGDGIGSYPAPGPIEIHGIILDQNQQPVGGVKITWNGYTAHSDIQGAFSIHGNGYTAAPLNFEKNGYIYDRFASDRCTSPESGIYTIWKLKGPETLINGSVGATIVGIIPRPINGRIYTIDLVKGSFSEGLSEGDLRISFQGPSAYPEEDGNPLKRYSWSYSIEAIDGGIVSIPANDGYKYLAPETGYQKKIDHVATVNSRDWFQWLEEYYVTSRHGRIYGRISFSVEQSVPSDRSLPYGPQVSFEISLNPSGSRNLEYDRSKSIQLGSPDALTLASPPSK